MPKTCLILMPHGSPNPEWNAPFRQLTLDLQAERGRDAVALAFLGTAVPGLLETVAEIAQNGVRKCQILPLFLSGGTHFHRDIPVLLEKVRAAFPEMELELLSPIGQHPRFFELLRGLIGDL